MNERALRVLEFTKIREMLAAYAISDPGKQKCRELQPLSDFNDVNRALDETEEAVVTLSYLGGNPMISFDDVSETGTGGPGYTIKGEFVMNGVRNPVKHTYGVLSMARAMHPNSAGSQFFIMTSDSPHLDGQYAAFGKVLTGMEYADQIVNTPRDRSDKPLEAQRIASIRVDTQGVAYPFDQL